MERESTAPTPLARAGGMALRVSTEAAAYVVLAALAAALRLAMLDWTPLDTPEAALALPAWQAANGMPAATIAGAPLLFQLGRAVFWLLPGDDASARLVAALAGVALVLAAWTLRPVLGRGAALAAAALFALSPLWVFLGRQVSPATLSAAAVVVVVGGLTRRAAADRDVVPVAAALALAAGGVAYTAAIAGLAFVLLEVASGRAEALRSAARELWPDGVARRRGASAFGLTLVLAATGLLTRPDGFGALLEDAAAWFGRFGAPGPGFVSVVLLSLAVYAGVCLAFGIAGAAIALRDGRPVGRLVAAWVVVGAAVAFLVGTPGAVPDVLLPLSLAAAVALGRLVEHLAERFEWTEDGVMTAVVLMILGFALVQAFQYGNAADAASLPAPDLWRLVLGSLALAGVIVALYALLWDARLALRVAGLATLGMLGLLSWSNGSWLAYRAVTDVREPMRPAFVTPDARRLAENLRSTSWSAALDPNAASALVDERLAPILAWPLRERRNLRWGPLDPSATDDAVVLAGRAPEVPAPEFTGAPYLGQTYQVAGAWQASSATIFRDSHSFMRWLLQRRPGGPPNQPADRPAMERAEMYIRVQPAPPSEVTP